MVGERQRSERLGREDPANPVEKRGVRFPFQSIYNHVWAYGRGTKARRKECVRGNIA